MLTGKQRKFAIEYIQCLNATEAARRAGYQGTDGTLAQVGYDNLRKHEISLFINQSFSESTMSAQEVLFQLTMIARGDIDDVVDSKGNIDLERARERGKTGLIKSSESRTITTEDSDIVEGKVVLHDKMRALEILAKYHALLVDRTRIEDWRTDLIKLLENKQITIEQIEAEVGYDIAQELAATVIIPSVDAGENE